MSPWFHRTGPLRVAPILGFLFLASGCDSSSTGPEDGSPGGSASLSVYLTDAPGDVADVWVEVTNVVLVGANGQVELLDEPTELISLLDLRDATLPLVQDAEVEVGAYHQIRFIVGGAVLQTVDDQVYTRGGATHPGGLPTTGSLQCPSCAQTGIKVRIPSDFEVEEGENGLLLDFDVTQSFGRQAGQSGMWVMRPTIQGMWAPPEEIESGEFGAGIEGSVVLGLDVGELPISLPICGGELRTVVDFTPIAVAQNLEDDEGDPLVFSGTVEADGSFAIRVLHDDTYTLGFRGETVVDGGTVIWTATSAPSSVTITDGADVSGVTYTILSASCSD